MKKNHPNKFKKNQFPSVRDRIGNFFVSSAYKRIIIFNIQIMEALGGKNGSLNTQKKNGSF